MIKFCKKCDIETDHYKSGGCRPCALNRSRERRKINPISIKEYAKEWREKNLQKTKEYRISRKDINRSKASEYHKIRYQEEAFRESAKARTRKWYLENKERARKYSAEYRNSNKDILIDYGKSYYKENKDRIKNRSREWRLLNLERCRANKRVYRKYNPEVHRSTNRKRKSKLSKGKVSVGLVNKLLLIQKGLCVCCRLYLDSGYHMDHIMPINLGGEHADANIQLLCPTCNLTKQAKHPVDFMQSKGYLL